MFFLKTFIFNTKKMNEGFLLCFFCKKFRLYTNSLYTTFVEQDLIVIWSYSRKGQDLKK